MTGDYHVLRIRGCGPTGNDIDVVELDGVQLKRVVSVEFKVNAGGFVTACIALEVEPDIELAGPFQIEELPLPKEEDDA